MTSATTTFRVGLVGAGAISPFHALAIQRVPGATIVGIAEPDAERARAFAARFKVAGVHGTLAELLDERLDVVHVLTPPESHAEAAIAALERGCHVYVEKPLATSVEACDRIEATARAAGRVVGVGHSLLRDPFVARALTLVERGAVGEVLGVDFHRCQPVPPYPGGPLPVTFREGGYPFRDLGIHGLYVVEALLGRITDVQVHVASRGREPHLHCDEWRVTAACERGAAHLHLSWAARPQQSVFLIQGTSGLIRADLFGMAVTVRRQRPLPEHATRLVNTLGEGRQMTVQALVNLGRAATGRIRQFHGLQELVAEFYRDLAAGRPPVVDVARARSAVYWTEVVARQGDRLKAAHVARFVSKPTAPVLVTGAAGFIGRELVERLLERGDRVRVLVRSHPVARWRDDPRVELVLGDLGDPEAVQRAVAGAVRVFHLGAATRGSGADFDRAIVGTKNLLAAMGAHGVRRLVHVSSLSVLHASIARPDSAQTESWPLEPRPGDRGHYTRSKLEAELAVRAAIEQGAIDAVILRPGEVTGPGAPLLTSGVAQRVGRRLVVLGNGRLAVPMVALPDVVDALMKADRFDPPGDPVYHVVDPTPITQNELVDRFVRASGERWSVVHVPLPIVYGAAAASQTLFGLLGRSAPLSLYRVKSALAPRVFDVTKIQSEMGWTPRLGVRAALDELFADVERRTVGDLVQLRRST